MSYILIIFMGLVVVGSLVFSFVSGPKTENTNTNEVEVNEEVALVDTDLETREATVTDAVEEVETQIPIEEEKPQPALTKPQETVVTTPIEPAPVPVPVVATVYQDGSYSNSLDYRVPSGNEPMTVNVSLKEDVVTDVSVSFEGKNDTSVKLQSRFVQAYKAQVVGKNIDDINLSRVGGASLTSKAFNQALVAIKTEARI